ncbi:MAG: hypothetical protein HQK54_16230, partial [Oligoflexales bacterium]|nr:hypothetical protein [Oligoflexales bacterium]
MKCRFLVYSFFAVCFFSNQGCGVREGDRGGRLNITGMPGNPGFFEAWKLVSGFPSETGEVPRPPHDEEKNSYAGAYPFPGKLLLKIDSERIDNDRELVLQVSGISKDDKVTVYSDNVCTTYLMEAKPQAEKMEFRIPLTGKNIYRFSATVTNAKGEVSSCSPDMIKYFYSPNQPVLKIFASPYGFAALKKDSSLVTWGRSDYGGDSSSAVESLFYGVKEVVGGRYAFSALKRDGSVVTWGSPSLGGNSSKVVEKISSGVKKIFSTDGAFSALKDDGSVITWG